VNRRTSASTVIAAIFLFVVSATAGAQPPPDPQDPPGVVITKATPMADDDPAALDPLEPDFSLVSLPTTLRLPKHGGDFHLSHRFNLNLVCSDSESDCLSTRVGGLFGLDSGANIGLEFRFGIMRNLQAVVQRTSLSQTIQLSLQYDAWHENADHPLSISGIAAIEGDHNLGANTPDTQETRYSPSLGLIVSRKVAGRLIAYLEPFWIHNTAGEGLPTRDTGMIGVGGRLRLSSTVNLVGEVAPRVSGLALRDPQFGFAIEKRVGGHVFSLTFTNNPGTTFRQISSGGNPDTLNLGFNLSRKFY
jgi:Membrane bound beta barrel domain (DUF5777)